LQNKILTKNLSKKLNFSLKSLKKGVIFGVGSGSISQRYRSGTVSAPKCHRSPTLPVSFLFRDLEMCPGIEETTLGLANVDLATLLVEKYGEKIRVRSRTCSRWVLFSLAETSSWLE
jgi:hypothetical protein